MIRAACLACGMMTTHARSWTNPNPPQPGCVTLCYYCGYVQAFDRDMQFRELTSAEMIKLTGDANILAAQKQREVVRRRGQ